MPIILEAPDSTTSVRKSLNIKRDLNSMRKTSIKESLNIVVKNMTVTLVVIGSSCSKLTELDFMMNHHLKNTSVRKSLMDKIC